MDEWLRVGPFLMGFGSADDALAATYEAIDAAREAGNAWEMANSQGEIADIYRRLGDIPRAIQEFLTTTELYYGLGYVGMLPGMKLLARVEVDRGNAQPAALQPPSARSRRARRAAGGDDQVGNPLEDARRLLSEEAFERAVKNGRAMGFDEAVAYALETSAGQPATSARISTQ